MRLLATLLVVMVVVAALLGPQFLFIVDETQMAIVTRFGEPRRSITNPGLNAKTPFVDTVTYFDKRRTLFDAPADSLLTKDKKRLVIDVYAIGRVQDPLVFFQKVRTAQGAVTASIPIIASELRQEIARDDQSLIIKESREEIMNKVTIAATPKLDEFGIAVVDVRIMRADFPPEIANSIYERMQAERQRIANAFRAEGAQSDLEIRADVDRQATIIMAEAERDANILRGEGEADAVSIFADSLEQGPEFYTFQRSLQAYKNFLPQNTTVVLPADSDLFQFLQTPGGPVSTAPPGPVMTMSDAMEVEAAARSFLAIRLGVSAEEPILSRLERVEWDDSSLGCPQPDVVYAQAIVSGFNLLFEHSGDTLEIHSNQDGSQLATCPS